MRFRREAEAAARLHHTNIVPIYFTGEENGVHFYAMELIDGPSLDQVIRHMRRDREFESSREVVSDTTKDSSEPLPDWVNETIAYERPQAKSGAANAKNVPGIGPSGSSVASGAKYFDTVATMIADVADALQHAQNNRALPSRRNLPANTNNDRAICGTKRTQRRHTWRLLNHTPTLVSPWFIFI
jgi:eukaryotic-like serine/threonine-protein kinase